MRHETYHGEKVVVLNRHERKLFDLLLKEGAGSQHTLNGHCAVTMRAARALEREGIIAINEFKQAILTF